MFILVDSEDYSKNSNISVEEWKKVLQNNSIITSKMLDVLKRIYTSQSHASTIKELIKARNNDFGTDEKSYNSLFVQNGKRVREFLNKTPIIEDGSEILWKWFFNGKYSSNGFIFKLKDELVRAMDDLYPNLDDFHVEENINSLNFFDYLVNRGFYFDKETIENYLLSLKVKPFVILTGNSGTGKTKLSQLFAEYLEFNNDNFKPIIKEKRVVDTLEITTYVKVGKSATSRGWSISREDIVGVIPKATYEDYFPININGFQTEGKFNINMRLFYKNSEELRSFLEDLANEDPNQKICLKLNVPIDDKEAVKDSDNEIVEDWFYSNYKIIPVGSNWTENRHIVGYYNIITEEYQPTPSFNLIKKAQIDNSKPYFLILDEMNLSHVERYFADFLSAIESGKPIPLYGDETLELPANLFIIGTVNVDETTYMFSPKVLDRANTIEFKTPSADEYMSEKFNIEGPDGNLEYLLNPMSDIDIKNRNIRELKLILNDTEVNGQKLWGLLNSNLTDFQNILKDSGFDFGFRVINEIIRFMVVAWKYEGEPSNWLNWERYFDAQIKQKILPKLHGSQRMIEKTLYDLFKKCLSGDPEGNLLDLILTKENTIYYESAIKLQEMLKVLEEQRYVSFIN